MSPLIRGNSLYFIIKEANTWHIANDAAEALGGDLVTINSKDEFDWGAENVWSAENYSANGINPKYVMCWVGFNDESIEGQYSWSSGEETDFDTDPTQLIVAQNWFDQQSSFSIWDYGMISTEGGWDYEGEDTRFNYSDRGSIVLMDASASFYANTGATIVGIAEIPLKLSITTLSTPTEGAGTSPHPSTSLLVLRHQGFYCCRGWQPLLIGVHLINCCGEYSFSSVLLKPQLPQGVVRTHSETPTGVAII